MDNDNIKITITLGDKEFILQTEIEDSFAKTFEQITKEMPQITFPQIIDYLTKK